MYRIKENALLILCAVLMFHISFSTTSRWPINFPNLFRKTSFAVCSFYKYEAKNNIKLSSGLIFCFLLFLNRTTSACVVCHVNRNNFGLARLHISFVFVTKSVWGEKLFPHTLITDQKVIKEMHDRDTTRDRERERDMKRTEMTTFIRSVRVT